jgi:hypothetical protein
MVSPHDLARAYDRHVAALWRENVDAAMWVADWLAAFWVEESSSTILRPLDFLVALDVASHGTRLST